MTAKDIKIKLIDKPSKKWCIDGEKLDRRTKKFEFTTISDFKIMMPNKNVEKLFTKKINLKND